MHGLIDAAMTAKRWLKAALRAQALPIVIVSAIVTLPATRSLAFDRAGNPAVDDTDDACTSIEATHFVASRLVEAKKPAKKNPGAPKKAPPPPPPPPPPKAPDGELP